MVTSRGRPNWVSAERIVKLLLMLAEEVIKLIDAIRR
jgi:hypothetical protein